jgi:DnaA-homolog protein
MGSPLGYGLVHLRQDETCGELLFSLKQLAFDFSVAAAPHFDNFVVGRNAELMQRLRHLLPARNDERSFYLWGACGSGRTHLLRAAVAAFLETRARAAYVGCASDTDFDERLHKLDLVAVDDVQQLGADAQIGFFNLYNGLRANGGVLIAAGSAAPMHLTLRADVVTRLAWGLVYEVHGLSDGEKAAALAGHASVRGFALQDDVSNYLLTHARRDMPGLVALLDALDRYSLESKRPVTVPLLRELLAAEQK